MKAFAYARPTTFPQAASILSTSKRPKGAGFDLLDLAKRGVFTPDVMVQLPRRAFGSISSGGGAGPGAISLGASNTLAEIATDATIRRECPALSDAAAEAATPQVRNAATLAGNVMQRPRCPYFRDPFFDCLKRGGTTCPARDGIHDDLAVFGNRTCASVHGSNLAVALMALRAEAILTSSKDGGLRLDEGFFVPPEVDPLRETVLTPEDLIVAFTIPYARASAYVEVNHKQSFDWAQAACAAVLDVSGGRIAKASIVLGHVAPIPWRAEAAEKALAGKSVADNDAIELAAQSATLGATPLRDNGHKVRLVKVVVRRAIQAALARSS